MSSNALREGFREVFRDPALLLIELGWRWAFGIVAIFACVTLALIGTTGVRADPRALESMSRMNPWELAQAIATALATAVGAVLRISLAAILFLSVCWTILSALGRRATLLRPALAPGADLRGCFGIGALRTAVTLAALLAWIVAGFAVGIAAAFTSSTTVQNFWLIASILIPVFLLLAVVWSAANWYLSLAPLFPGDRWTESIADARKFVQAHRDEILEISIALGAMRVVVLIAALTLSFAISAVVTNLRVVVADLVAISLLYFLIADFLNIAKLAAFARLRDAERNASVNAEPVPQVAEL
jgi:hypothetical protein